MQKLLILGKFLFNLLDIIFSMSLKNIGFLLSTTKGKSVLIIFSCLIHLVLGSFGIVNALTLRKLIDVAVSYEYDKIAYYGQILAIEGIVFVVFLFIDRIVTEASKAAYENQFKERLFKQILSKEYYLITKKHSAEWLNKLTNDTAYVAKEHATLLPSLIEMAIKLVGAVLAILYLEPNYSLLLVPVSCLFIIFNFVYREREKVLDRREKQANDFLTVFMQERLSNLLIVKAFSKEEESVNDASFLMKHHRKTKARKTALFNFSRVIFDVLIRFAYVFVAISSAYEIYEGKLTYGTFIAMLELIIQVQNPLNSATTFGPRFNMLGVSCERLREVEDYKDDEQEYPQNDINIYYDNEFKKLGLKGVNFEYNDELVLKNFSMNLNKYEIVGLTGDSGVGKSTVLKLLMSLYKIKDGERYLDKKQLDGKYRRLFAYVPQGNQLMSGTIQDIVCFGETFDKEKFDSALSIAVCDDFVKSPTMTLGEKGSGLSEGQIQRLAIARAIYSNRPVILLDEATSSLDERTEAKLLKNIRRMTDKSVIIVTHRNSALKICDKVYNLKRK